VYRVVRHLATGGMGSVYDVEDQSVGKRYVLKTLHPQLVAREDLAHRMREEAKTLGRIQHPNIVDVITAGLTKEARPVPYFVMERLNGNNLRLLLEKRGSLELSHCYQIAIDVADALEHAHENGVIHRDVKPENIFLHRNHNGTTTTKLLDFGIMRVLDRKQSHTQGKFIGTLRYASPEQIMGGELGPATDIYSLGVVVYEMLSGRGPFDDAGDAYAIGAAHAQLPAPPLSKFARVPPGLEALVMSSLAKMPSGRPRDCFTFAGKLRELRREEEAAPRSVTAMAVLSSVPDTRAATADPYLGTEPSASSGPTQQGMIPPSVLGDTLMAASASENIGTAPTMASEPKAAPIRPGIDRNAATRASQPGGHTQRLAQHGTMMDDGSGVAPDDVVRAALAEPAPLVVPPMSPGGPPSGEIVYPRPATYASTATGPLSGEARTRPPEHGIILPIVAIVAVCGVIIGGAVLIVKKPWVKSEPAAATTAPAPPPPPTATATASAVPAATATASATASAATSTQRPSPHHVVPSSTAPTGKKPAKPQAPAPSDVGFD
jgi:serine/threonine-protein kinase